MDPILKWPGGKRRLAPLVRSFLTDSEFHVEPFAGGVAVALQTGQRLVLNDTSGRLMNLYIEVKNRPEAVLECLEAFRGPFDPALYYREREVFNTGARGPAQAARLLFLNKTGFNGLYRENKYGAYNVAAGKLEGSLTPLPDRDVIFELSRRLEASILHSGDFENVGVPYNACIYADPPYLGGFSGYSSTFGVEDHRRLARWLLKMARRGAEVVVSNADVEGLIEVYEGFEIVWRGDVRRSISRDGSTRSPASEVILKPLGGT